MKKTAVMITCALAMTVFKPLYAGTIHTTMDEINNSLGEVREAAERGDEQLVNMYFHALEITKRATTPVQANIIKTTIVKTSDVVDAKFVELRSTHSFFDISIAWAVNQLTDAPIPEILASKSGKDWKDVLDKYYPCEKGGIRDIEQQIIKLNPPKN